MNKKPNKQQVIQWLKHHYGITGQLSELVGDVDHNYKYQGEQQTFTVKISRVTDLACFEFENALMIHLSKHQAAGLNLPQPILNQHNQWLTTCDNIDGELIIMRVLTWVSGVLWSDYLPHSPMMLCQLGQQAAALDTALETFSHPLAERAFEWDLAQSLWLKDYLDLFDKDQQKLLLHFTDLFESQQSEYQQLRRQVIHNDLNDNNVLVAENRVSGCIDFGDAIHTQLINELAIVCAYAMMGQSDVLGAAAAVIKGYHSVVQLQQSELDQLYHLIGMRLAVSVTQAAIARRDNPANTYKTISEKPAWEVLKQWHSLPPAMVRYTVRLACGYNAHPQQKALIHYLEQNAIKLAEIFPEHHEKTAIMGIDLSVGSTLLGAAADYENHAEQQFKISQQQAKFPQHFLAGGYGEARSFYAADAFSYEGNSGKEYRTMHLGLDVWLPAFSAIHAPLDGRIVGFKNNDNPRDYGPTIILEHQYENGTFYSLYGHLALKTLELHQLGDEVKRGALLAWVGEADENGGWSPHLHFQIMHDMLGNEGDFPGACRPLEWPVYQALCPDPYSFISDPVSHQYEHYDNQTIIDFRHQHLGKSLSLAYSEPIQMLRGDDVYLIDQFGQKYLDTCNNVAHVGHENAAVVRAGQQQMAILNTNSRYLHPAIIKFTKALLETLPNELSVVHLVNSGSEANELALRMAQAYSGGKDVIALESGYHGNSNSTIAISSYKFDGKGGQGAPENTHIVPLPDTFRGRHCGADAADQYASYVQHHIHKLQAQGHQLSAFIAESIVSCGGQIELPTGYLKQVYQMVRAAGGVCIADEVQVGCGRIGSHFWAFQSHDVVPDILTIGKPIGNGHPLAVVVCSQRVADAFANGMEYFNTFGGNPVSATIGLAVLQQIKDKKLQQNALETGQYLKTKLAALQAQHPIIKDVRGQGLFLGFELCDDNLNPLPQQAQYLADRMRDLGILISTDGPDHNVIKIKPPITFSQQHVDELLHRLTIVLAENPMNY
ncbi:aminotransferase class III-fold pyridoxal phosphate-dependent enzyme [Marinicella sp. S1101]|uniref:aminotransferase class III-fold pyridoxal phosphate-dependent enzyme n=1 Tax=Marinicella marina TaxID=2996016 RepID=UPI002260AC40|nr:aminotransferase class III-fold pyridoxal phosphate-dependent enzyme [Marinicella marina]MCX7554338.1 aminotransferase class III-fold pyridoxal phosphate-dependent enzyme [Marinicella marina]MDJ1138671.1 aminotransferase class III-fold pyridoxal phosphate-dependent enzyme [Marinicella marina]